MAQPAERGSKEYRFGPFVLDLNRRELRRGTALVPLTDKALDLLGILIGGAGRTVTRSELMAALWPDTTVEESNLTQTMFLLRKALDDVGKNGFIRTVRGQGYTFVFPIDVNETPDQASDSKSGWRAWRKYAAVIAGIAMLVGLAVVYFREPAPEARVVRSTILNPEKTRFTDGLLALSPDGRRIAFSATGEDGKSKIWIRPLDSQTAQPLAGTDGANFPFWSPDSRWIGFFAGGKLKKIDTQGGPPIELADATVPQGGSWSSKGVILFAPTFDALQKISSNGGPVSRAADPAVGNNQCCPWFLPDGEHYLFAAQTHGSLQGKLLVGSLSSTATKVIGEAPAIYAQGNLLYLKDSTLMAQPFDVKGLRTTGGPEAVAGPVGHFRSPLQAGFFSASSNGTLAYLAPPPVFGRQLTWFDRKGKVLGTVGEARAIFDVELSPDRTRLAATIADNGNVDVWIYDLAGGPPARFTFDPAAEYRAVWSPEGRSILFSSGRKGHVDFYRKSADGAGAEELLYADMGEKYPVSWSRDGKSVMYFVTHDARTADLWMLPLVPERSGAPLKPKPFLDHGFSFGQFSPDGRWVAYESDEPSQPEIYVAPFSRPTEKHQVSPNGGARPRWRQDGKEIFYQTPGGQLMAAEVRISGDAVVVGAVRELFGGIPVGGGYFYDVSADGQRILGVAPANRTSPVPITLVQNWASGQKRKQD